MKKIFVLLFIGFLFSYSNKNDFNELFIKVSQEGSPAVVSILSEKTEQPWYEITSKVEHVTAELMKKTKGVEIFPNVDLYSASVYYMLGIPMDLNTPIFAISRAAGWAAHIIEEKFAEAAPKPMLYRPKAVYVGKYAGPQGCKYVSIEKRN